MTSFIRRTAVCVTLALSLAFASGCGENPTKAAVYTCTSAATLIDVAAEGVRSGKISVAEKPKFSAAIDKVAKVCENPIAPTSASLKQAAVDELVLLLTEKGVL